MESSGVPSVPLRVFESTFMNNKVANWCGCAESAVRDQLSVPARRTARR